MKQKKFEIKTPGRGFTEFTHMIQEFVRSTAQDIGLCHIFIHHTSASLIICENADPDVLRDLEHFTSDLVPDGYAGFVHVAEGPDDMPAHVRNVLTQTSITIPISNGSCDLGAWQGVYLWEHRHKAHRRKITISVT